MAVSKIVPPPDASDVVYNNTTSGLISTNTQNAIDEVNTKANKAKSIFLSRYQTGGVTDGHWYKLFSITYSSWNVCNIRMVVKCGYRDLSEVFARIRFIPSGIQSNDSCLKVINSGGNDIPVAMYQIDTNTVGFACPIAGSYSTIGFEIFDIACESNTIGVNNFSVENPFVDLGTTKPTLFGEHARVATTSDIYNRQFLGTINEGQSISIPDGYHNIYLRCDINSYYFSPTYSSVIVPYLEIPFPIGDTWFGTERLTYDSITKNLIYYAESTVFGSKPGTWTTNIAVWYD